MATTTYTTVPLDDYAADTIRCVTSHRWERTTKRGEQVEHVYQLAHADTRCPNAQRDAGAIEVASAAAVNPADLPWPCSTCYPWEQAADRRPNGDRFDSIDAPERHGEPGKSTSSEPAATESQRRLLLALSRASVLRINNAEEPQLSAEELERIATTATEAVAASKSGASRAIDAMKRDGISPLWTPLTEHDPRVVVDRQPTEGLRSNRYAARCAACGGSVEAEGGWLTKGTSGWEVRHKGECPAGAAAAPEQLADVPAGHYAVDSSGDNDLAFYRVDRPEDGEYAGRVFVKMIVGGHPDSNVRRSAVPGILARIAEVGPAVAAKRYADEIGRCSRCNRHLTDKASRDAGMGPECRSKAV